MQFYFSKVLIFDYLKCIRNTDLFFMENIKPFLLRTLTISLFLILHTAVFGQKGVKELSEEEQKLIDYNTYTWVIGEWKHEVTTFPSGDQNRYERYFYLYGDQSFKVNYLSKLDTNTKIGWWTVHKNHIELHTYIIGDSYDTTLVFGDKVHIDHIDDSTMFLTRVHEDSTLRKTSLYKRINRQH